MNVKNRNCLSTWFPIIEAAGLPVPTTRIVHAPPGGLVCVLDGVVPDGWEDFLAALRSAAAEVGGPPWFLRTGLTSGKHDWERTCCVTDLSKINNHVCQLVEFSMLADFLGLATDVWAVREMLKTAPLFTAFRGFPVVREFRVFVDDGQVACVHGYWPIEAVAQGRPSDPGWQRLLEAASVLPSRDLDTIHALAKAAAAVLPGAWSVDLLQDASGKWWLTDCADAGCSFHWPGCENEKRWKRREAE